MSPSETKEMEKERFIPSVSVSLQLNAVSWNGVKIEIWYM